MDTTFDLSGIARTETERALNLPAADIDDYSQEVAIHLLSVVERVDTTRPVHAQLAFLKRAARNRAVDLVRRHRTFVSLDDDSVSWDPEDVSDPESIQFAKETQTQLVKAFVLAHREMNPVQRRLFREALGFERLTPESFEGKTAVAITNDRRRMRDHVEKKLPPELRALIPTRKL